MNLSLFNMKDYSKTIIYKIVCNITGEVYYGHTVQGLETRQRIHEAPSNRCTSRQIIDRGDWQMIEIEKYPCANKKEAHVREGWWIKNNECVNKYVAGRTVEEYRQTPEYQEKVRIYKEANKDKMAEYHRNYEKIHKEQISAYKKKHNAKPEVKENQSKVSKIWRDNNKEHIAKQKKEYHQRNAEKISQQKKEYRARQDKQAVRERDRAYELANAEAISERKRAYYKWKMSMDNMHRVAIDLFD